MSVDASIRGPAKRVETAKEHPIEIVSYQRDFLNQRCVLRLKRDDGLFYEVQLADSYLAKLLTNPLSIMPDRDRSRRQEEIEELFQDIGAQDVPLEEFDDAPDDAEGET